MTTDAFIVDAVRSPIGKRNGTLSTVRGEFPSEKERDAFEAPILETYEREGSPYFATARLWDDGVIDPLDTRRVLALGISAAQFVWQLTRVRVSTPPRRSGRASSTS